MGLGAGVCFALANVLIRRTAHIEIEQKVMAVFLGVIAVAAAFSLLALRVGLRNTATDSLNAE